MTLCLDLGPSSIGWALIRDGQDGGLVEAGVRVFPEGVDAFDTSKERSRNEQRRIARGMRRQVRRRVARRQKLIEALMASGLWPTDSAAQERLYRANPWDLRAQALIERIEPYEIGRVILHLNRRRGFWSNRKGERGNSEVRGVLAEINQNEQERMDAGHQATGQYLAGKLRKTGDDHRTPDRGEEDPRRVRGRHLSREQIYHEFDLFWRKQSEFYPRELQSRFSRTSLGGGP